MIMIRNNITKWNFPFDRVVSNTRTKPLRVYQQTGERVVAMSAKHDFNEILRQSTIRLSAL